MGQLLNAQPIKLFATLDSFFTSVVNTTNFYTEVKGGRCCEASDRQKFCQN